MESPLNFQNKGRNWLTEEDIRAYEKSSINIARLVRQFNCLSEQEYDTKAKQETKFTPAIYVQCHCSDTFFMFTLIQSFFYRLNGKAQGHRVQSTCKCVVIYKIHMNTTYLRKKSPEEWTNLWKHYLLEAYCYTTVLNHYNKDLMKWESIFLYIYIVNLTRARAITIITKTFTILQVIVLWGNCWSMKRFLKHTHTHKTTIWKSPQISF